VTFPWLEPNRPVSRANARADAQLRDLRERAALFYRLGYTAEAAIARLTARCAWEHGELTDAVIAKEVNDTYARRPSGNL
jgi:hypothetical protein